VGIENQERDAVLGQIVANGQSRLTAADHQRLNALRILRVSHDTPRFEVDRVDRAR
jgi:hypothetical protein